VNARPSASAGTSNKATETCRPILDSNTVTHLCAQA
jgi:hypothetical protein